MNFFYLLLIKTYISLLILRFWIQWMQLNPLNQLSVMIFRSTDYLLNKINKLIPRQKKIDTGTILLTYCILTTKNVFLETKLFGFSFYQKIIISFLEFFKETFNLFLVIFFLKIFFDIINFHQFYLKKSLNEFIETALNYVNCKVKIGSHDLSIMIFIIAILLLNIIGRKIFGIYWSIL